MTQFFQVFPSILAMIESFKCFGMIPEVVKPCFKCFYDLYCLCIVLIIPYIYNSEICNIKS